MKKLLVIYILIQSTFCVFSQNLFTLKQGESSLIYSLPKTKFCIEVKTEKVTQKPGVFFKYSERYLATNKIITERKTTYRLKNIQVKTEAIPDLKRTYSFIPTKKSEANHISVNSKGILCGVNMTTQPEAKLINEISVGYTEDSDPSTILPLGEEFMMAGSEAKLAEGAAKQIYRIRESRLGLLTADVEKLPADGASFKSMLDGLNNMEKQLTELFIGTTITETQTQLVHLTPDAPIEKEVLFRLSALLGIVSTDDLSGKPFYITIKPATVNYVAASPKAKHEPVEIYTILPSATQVSIGDGVNTFYNNQFYVPQFGEIIPLSQNLLTKTKVIIRVDQETGRLLGVE